MATHVRRQRRSFRESLVAYLADERLVAWWYQRSLSCVLLTSVALQMPGDFLATCKHLALAIITAAALPFACVRAHTPTNMVIWDMLSEWSCIGERQRAVWHLASVYMGVTMSMGVLVQVRMWMEVGMQVRPGVGVDVWGGMFVCMDVGLRVLVQMNMLVRVRVQVGMSALARN
jgi:hypothetical protein